MAVVNLIGLLSSILTIQLVCCLRFHLLPEVPQDEFFYALCIMYTNMTVTSSQLGGCHEFSAERH